MTRLSGVSISHNLADQFCFYEEVLMPQYSGSIRYLRHGEISTQCAFASSRRQPEAMRDPAIRGGHLRKQPAVWLATLW